MRSALLALLALAATARAAPAPALPQPQGFVTDAAGVLSPATRARLTDLLEELRSRTGAEIAVVTVPTTAPLDDFGYAMALMDAWKPGRKGEDTGVVFLLAVRDRKVRIVTGYGLEGILPDGLVGAIEDRDVVPRLRVGDVDGGVWGGVAALATRIAASRGVTLTGAPPPEPAAAPPELPGWAALLLFLLVGALVLYQASHPGLLGGGFYPPFGGFGGGFGGGGGGFGGFGGGGSGGGGAGRGW
ncbi:MAG TPA: TPM domain-containing protein [Candidatus Binatia bacterium]|nr:TPM domain-containing protein [Candidatus Binatia bacterium]